MWRVLGVLSASVFAIVGAAPVAHGGESSGSRLADLLLGAGEFGPGSVTAVLPTGEQVELQEGHAPLPPDSLIVDAGNLSGPETDAIGDAGDGASDTIDIASASAVLLDVSPGALERIEPWLAAARGSGVVDGVGFASPFGGGTPSLGAQSVVFGVRTNSWITAEEDPVEIKVSLRFQLTVGGRVAGEPPADSSDANGGNNRSVDLYQAGGIFGTGAYLFPGGVFTERPTDFFGLYLGDRAIVAGPLAELEGVEDFDINLVEFPLFDRVEVGGPDDWGRLRIDTLTERDADGNGVVDDLEVAPEPTPTPVEEQPTPEPEPDPLVEEQPATPEEPLDEPVDEPDQIADQTDEAVEDSPDPAVVQPSEEAPAGAELVGDDGDGGGSSLLLIAALVLLVAGAAGLYFLLARRKKCVPESEAVAAAEAEVGALEAEVGRAADKVARAEATAERAAGARQQAALREQEASIALRDARSELALAEGRLNDARARLAVAQRAYGICMGLIAPAPSPEQPRPAGPPPRPETPGPPVVDAGPGDGGSVDAEPGGAETGGGPPGIVIAPPAAEPAPPEREPVCRDGDEKDGKVISSTEFRILGGMITVNVGTSAWARAGRTLNAEAFAELDTSTVEKLSAGIETGRGPVRIDVRIPITVLTVKCVQILVCDNDRWVDSGRTKRVEVRSPARDQVILPVGADGGRGLAKDRRLAGRMVVEAQGELEILQQNQNDAAECECD